MMKPASNGIGAASHTIVQAVVTPQIPPQTPKKRASECLREPWPDIRELTRPRRRVSALGLVLMAIGRVCGLVLPASTKYLIDDVIGKQHTQILIPLVLVVVGATLIQGATSFSLTQMVSKSAQRLIGELRCKVQAHVAHLPVSYYHANKSG